MRTYESIRTEAIIKRRDSDVNDWALGDLFREAVDLAEGVTSRVKAKQDYELTEEEKEFSLDARKILERLADDIGMAKKAVYLRERISRRVDPAGDLGWIRRSTLTYSAMRELYAVDKDVDLNVVAKRAVSQNMTIREIRVEMESYRTGKAVDSGLVKCRICNDTIKDDTKLIALSFYGNRFVFCGWNCTSIYVSSRAAEAVVLLTETAPLGLGDSYEEGDTFEEEVPGEQYAPRELLMAF